MRRRGRDIPMGNAAVQQNQSYLHSLPGLGQIVGKQGTVQFAVPVQTTSTFTGNVAVLGRNGWLSLHSPNRALPGKPTQAGSHPFRY